MECSGTARRAITKHPFSWLDKRLMKAWLSKLLDECLQYQTYLKAFIKLL